MAQGHASHVARHRIGALQVGEIVGEGGQVRSGQHAGVDTSVAAVPQQRLRQPSKAAQHLFDNQRGGPCCVKPLGRPALGRLLQPRLTDPAEVQSPAAATEHSKIPVFLGDLGVGTGQRDRHPVTDESKEDTRVLVEMIDRQSQDARGRHPAKEVRSASQAGNAGSLLDTCPALQAIEHLHLDALGEAPQHHYPATGVNRTLAGAPGGYGGAERTTRP